MIINHEKLVYPYYSQKLQPYLSFVHLVCTNYCHQMSGLKNLPEQTVQLCFDKKLQIVPVTFPKNDRMDPYGVNPMLSIFLTTPTPIAM